jgi:hypothetical protein
VCCFVAESRLQGVLPEKERLDCTQQDALQDAIQRINTNEAGAADALSFSLSFLSNVPAQPQQHNAAQAAHFSLNSMSDEIQLQQHIDAHAGHQLAAQAAEPSVHSSSSTADFGPGLRRAATFPLDVASAFAERM